MKLLITGSSGMLGGNIVSELGNKYEIFGIYRNISNPVLKNQVKLDLTEFQKVKDVVQSIDPEFVIHCAALANVELCEENYKMAQAVNAFATRNIAQALKPKTKLVYISTDSIYDGKKGNYNETDLPSPLNNYAETKLEGEHFIEECCDNHVIIRTNFFGWNHVKGESFAEWIINNLSKKKSIMMFTDVIFTPVTANTLSLLIEELFNIDFIGKLNIGSSDSMSKYDFGLNLAELFKLDSSLIKPSLVDSFAFKAKRPKNMSLNVSKAKGIFGFLPEIKEELFTFYKKRKMVKV